MSENALILSGLTELSMRERFETYIYNTFVQEIQSWDETIRADVYALSFFIYDHNDDPRQPMVHLSYNTTDCWRTQIPRAFDANEAKWNFAFWPQEFKAIIAAPDDGYTVNPDPEGMTLRDAWLDSEGMNYSDEVFDGTQAQYQTIDRAFQLMEKWQDVTQAFVDLCVRVAQRLHKSGFISLVFGRTIPIIIHELEYYQQIADQTRTANPPGSTQEFEDWATATL